MRNEEHSHLNFGYVQYEIVTNSAGREVDYRFKDMNENFEAITGLQREEALNMLADEVLSNSKEEQFDWISFYGQLGFSPVDNVFEQYSILQKRWYRAQVSAVKSNHLDVYFYTVSKESRLMRFSVLLNQFSLENYDYVKVCEMLTQIYSADQSFIWINCKYQDKHFYTDGKQAVTEQFAQIFNHKNMQQFIKTAKDPKKTKTHKVSIYQDFGEIFQQVASFDWQKSIPSGAVIRADLMRFGKTYGIILLVNPSPEALQDYDYVESGADLVASTLERFSLGMQLQSSEAGFRAIFDQSPFAIEQFDSKGNIIRINQACLELFGIEDESELAQYNLFDDSQLGVEMKEALRRGEQVRFEAPFDFRKVTAYRTRHTGVKWFRALFSPLTEPVSGYLMQLEDISKQKKAELQMQAHERQFQLIIDNLPNAVSILNENLDLIYVNQKGLDLLEIDSDSALKINAVKDGFISREVAREWTHDMEKNGHISSKELNIVNPKGRNFWTLLSAMKIIYQNQNCILTAAQDITYRKLTEETLQESEEKFRVLAENTSAGIFIIHKKLFVYVNQGLANLLESSKDALMKKSFTDYIDPEYLALIQQRGAARVAGENVPSNYELKIVTAKGESRWCELNPGTIKYNGRLMNLGTLFDITDRKNAAQILRETNEKLEDTLAQLQEAQEKMVRQERLTAVGQVSAGIAHDFNNILSAILGFSDLLEYSIDSTSSSMELVKEIKRSGRRAAKLVQQLLDYTSKGMRRPKTINLSFFLRDSVKLMQEILGNSVQLKLNISNENLEIEADTEQLHQIIKNISENACDALPNGGIFSVTAEKVQVDGAEQCVICQHAIQGEWLCISFADTGIGISPDLLKRVFEPFFTTKQIGQGTGLGLSQVFGIVSQYQGHITIESEVGKGTKLAIYWPIGKLEPNEISLINPITNNKGGRWDS
jgi:PAS domain S-box-containing protein